MRSRTKSLGQLRAAVAAGALATGALVPSLAQAHFILTEPASMTDQGILGDPQKASPCGTDAASPGTPTGLVTTYRAGQTINLTIKETVFHPGHYRVAIAQNAASLPAEPPVTPETMPNNTPCGSVPISMNPTLPILADGIFKHTASYSTPQTVQIKLPAGYTCKNCTLQVIQWMYNHVLNNPGGCFYHHCATVNIVDDTDGDTMPPADMSMPPPADLAEITPPPTMSEGCSYHLGAARAQAAAPVAALFILLGLSVRRRRRA